MAAHSKRRRPRELSADENQRHVLRGELHHLVDQIIDQLPAVQRMSKEMGSGYAGSTITDGRGGGDGLTTVERLATQRQPDPAVWAADALSGWDDTLTAIRRTARRFRGLMPMTTDEAAELERRQRDADVPICGLCQLPIPDKVHRIDDQAYHANTCYFKVWRARKDTA